MDSEGASSKLDLMKVAQMYNEIKALRNEGDFMGIEFFNEEIP